MFNRRSRFSKRLPLAFLAAALTATAAGAATIHRFSVSQATGSGGAQTFLQSSASSSALQGEVGGSSPNTGIKLPFGALGEYDASTSTFGTGVLGVSTTGYALAGESLSDMEPSILAYPGGNGPGLEATTQSGSQNPAIIGTTAGFGNAILGEVTGPNSGLSYAIEGDGGITAVYGHSEFGGGVYGKSGAYIGVQGEDDSTATPGPNVETFKSGVSGSSTAGAGVVGINSNTSFNLADGRHVGVYAQSMNGDGLYASSTNNSGAYITNDSTSNPALQIVQGQAGGNAIIVSNPSTNLLILDGSGNLDLLGNVVDKGGTFARTRNANTDMLTYGEQSTEPTTDDVGTARLVGGTAMVPLSADFRQTIDPSSPYMVIVTPYGENNGLYVASRTAAGFVVRESHGGRSNLSFDYRVVARSYGAHEGRLPHESMVRPNAARDEARLRASAPKFTSWAAPTFPNRPATRHYKIPAITHMPTRAELRSH